jgi:hypothetical protein
MSGATIIALHGKRHGSGKWKNAALVANAAVKKH